MQEIFDNAIQGFDLSYCLAVNILVYLVVKGFELKNILLTQWKKRIVLLVVIGIMATLYHLMGADSKVLLNSSILAPVSWSWIFKPLVKLLNIDYNKE